ncbi:uroporphyrinogen-III synthase [Halorhodospira halophila]|uniref:Uroporphyrinogen-III synthase n=1 Tax=Halorhodospira halophila (strain DSM 244 / SL1) TaxID=349124 RepID=A1WVU0_HALHL|nr:uroporphyrinogen-III synthase [Halorhodospira halophila]ABM61802.1 uroporphyrinogen-III synthase [Halorhodospira halophila SL1]MBK1728870.1 uroporphyrinogen-III synthase [Halorhodospira halophila]
MTQPLDGTGVIVTRPTHQAEGLVHALEAAGAGVWRFPTLDIIAEPEDAARQEAARRAACADWLIFVSQNAVAHGLPRIRAAGGPAGHARCATVGQGTAEALRRNGIEEVLYPRHGATSEDLLAETDLGRISAGRVMIVRGVGGRPYLAEALRARGAEVDFLEVYRRVRPSTDPAPLLEAAEADRVQVVVATSGEVLDNFLELVGDRGRRWLARAGVVVIGERVATMAAPHAGHVEIAATAAEEELTAATARAARAVAEIRSRRR